MMGKKKLKKLLKALAADLLIAANDLSLRHREDCVSVEKAREIARKLRDVATSLAEVAYDIDEEV